MLRLRQMYHAARNFQNSMKSNISLKLLGQLLDGRCSSPRSILGPHSSGDDQELIYIRAWLPQASQAWVIDSQGDVVAPLRKVHPAGLFEAACRQFKISDFSNPSNKKVYRFRVVDKKGSVMTKEDPYQFPSLLTDYDRYLLGEGQHWKSYDKLGAHVCKNKGVEGVNFLVWAPNARSVSVIGDFNGWNKTASPMQNVDSTGYWELFVPNLKPGALYKYAVNQNGNWVEKFDPHAFASECPPQTASKVADLSTYKWQDKSWLEERSHWDWLHKPISIYECHLGSFKKPNPDQLRDGLNPETGTHWLSYRQIADVLIPHVKKLGYTHIEIMPVAEHPLTASWGYQIVGYFCPTARYGKPEDFMYLVDKCHEAGIGVIMDWVPAHFPKDANGLARFDGTALYEHQDPRQGEHRDWGTYIFNYSRYEVRNFLISNALFWLDKYHIDGLRVDAVASMLYLDYSRKEGDWVPNEFGGRENLAAVSFLKMMNEQVGIQYPGVLTIAEESTAWPGVSRPTYVGGLGFSLKWNMGWMNDTLRYFRNDPVYRKYHQNNLTFSLMYAFSENFVLPLSHDEVVHCKGALINQMPGDMWKKYANLRLLTAYQWTHPGKKLLFMGAELGQWTEWDFDNELDWGQLQYDSPQGLVRMTGDLNTLYKNEPALHELEFDWEGFEWIDCNNSDASTLSYLRKSKSGEFIVVVANFTPIVRYDFWVGVPKSGTYEVIFNSDSSYYSGSNVGQAFVKATAVECQGRPASMQITLPPLALVMFKLVKNDKTAEDSAEQGAKLEEKQE